MVLFQRARRYAYLFLSIVLLVSISCKTRNTGHILRGTGLYKEKELLSWSFNVGVLYDSQFTEPKARELREVLRRVEVKVSQLLPGFSLRLLMDQPLNSVFMMTRTLGKEGVDDLRLANNPNLLMLHPSPQAEEQNRKRMQEAGWKQEKISAELARLAILQKKNNLSGYPWISEKWTSSDTRWRYYSSRQVRYDLILTNAFVYPDDFSQRHEFVRGTDGGILWRLSKMSGRTSMEGYGAYVSIFTALALDTNSSVKDKDAVVDLVLSAVLALIFPFLPSQLMKHPSQVDSWDEWLSLKKKKKCRSYWKYRLLYLRAIESVQQGSCLLLSRFSHHPNPPFPSVGRDHSYAIQKTRKDFQKFCGN